jgi:hypothetical protein
VNGYTDTSGTPAYNQGLSVRRAQPVAGELVRDRPRRARAAEPPRRDHHPLKCRPEILPLPLREGVGGGDGATTHRPAR